MKSQDQIKIHASSNFLLRVGTETPSRVGAFFEAIGFTGRQQVDLTERPRSKFTPLKSSQNECRDNCIGPKIPFCDAAWVLIRPRYETVCIAS